MTSESTAARLSPAGTGRALRRTLPTAFVAGAAVGVLGGTIGLGGAEFRLPLLIGPFGPSPSRRSS